MSLIRATELVVDDKFKHVNRLLGKAKHRLLYPERK